MILANNYGNFCTTCSHAEVPESSAKDMLVAQDRNHGIDYVRKIFDSAVIAISNCAQCMAIYIVAVSLVLTAIASCVANDAAPPKLIEILQEHCVRCHGAQGKAEAGVDLHAIGHLDALVAQPKLLGDMISAIDSGLMPPEGEPQLDQALRNATVAGLKRILSQAVDAQATRVRTPIRRMNRFQYNNAVKDLLELRVEVYPLPERLMRDLDGYFQPHTGKMPLKVKVASRPLSKDHVTEPHLGGVTPFPQDLRAEHGFDNRGDHITLSPILLEAFLQLSQSIFASVDFHRQNVGIWDTFFAEPSLSVAGSMHTVVRDRLAPFLSSALRRPVEDKVLERYVAYGTQRLEAGASFTETMKSVAAAVISSPRFLYLYDGESVDSTLPLDSFSLASRLSFFLWGSIPDKTLCELAAAGRLREPEVLRGQVQRMLRDDRIKRFCDSFPSQWLQLERIISSEPDPQLFPQFYFAKYRASMHMMLEPLLLFETVLVENQSILQLIDANFSYRSDLLNAWYRDGSQGNAGPPTQVVLRRVPVTDARQGGVISCAAVMTMTSGTTRTKPITRGAWLATVILNDPPPPPPDNVPPLADKPSASELQLTLRERFAAHRRDAACAGCHRRIDPLGFALENYDAAGIWRDKYENGRPVDASGQIFGRHKFHDIVGFKAALKMERERFARAFAGHLLSFALGRETTVADSRSLDQAVASAAREDFRIQSLIEAIVLSESFRD